MSFFNRFRRQWKHPDPSIREAAVARGLDQGTLEQLAESDPAETVRSAAVRAMTDQQRLARIAAGPSSSALVAVQRLEDRQLVMKVAQSAASGAVREAAVERIDDGLALHRISTSDTDARVRLKARRRFEGPDPVRDFIRAELAKLNPDPEMPGTEPSFQGTLEEVATHLIGDTRFRINGWLDQEIPGLAKVRAVDAPGAAPEPAPEGAAEETPRRARFLAFKRTQFGEPEEAATSHVYFEITVWRKDATVFQGAIEERSLQVTADAATWSRVSNESVRTAGRG